MNFIWVTLSTFSGFVSKINGLQLFDDLQVNTIWRISVANNYIFIAALFLLKSKGNNSWSDWPVQIWKHFIRYKITTKISESWNQKCFSLFLFAILVATWRTKLFWKKGFKFWGLNLKYNLKTFLICNDKIISKIYR